jgi:hypothetical protein
MMHWRDAVDRLRSLGYSVTLEEGKIRYAYCRKGNPSRDEIIPLLEVLKVHKAEAIDYLRLLQTPQAKLEKPILIESGILKDRFYLVANEEQAREVEREGKVCYLPGEIRTLLVNSAGMEGESLKDYLGKIHAVKKTFEGTRIQ